MKIVTKDYASKMAACAIKLKENGDFVDYGTLSYDETKALLVNLILTGFSLSGNALKKKKQQKTSCTFFKMGDKQVYMECHVDTLDVVFCFIFEKHTSSICFKYDDSFSDKIDGIAYIIQDDEFEKYSENECKE